ncbi:AMP-binding enzyme [Lysinibacillus sp. NPDC093688]|uniref:AMP-binding enzyme n=1 Tax=Lysinibacillus sp. NPDC093688 TaxID=3390577 RepID=UPI003D00498A
MPFIRNPIDHIDEEELRNYCKLHLTPYKIPNFVEKVDELSKTNSGKIFKQQ